MSDNLLVQCSHCKGEGVLYRGIVTHNLYDRYAAEHFKVLDDCKKVRCRNCDGEGIQSIYFL